MRAPLESPVPTLVIADAVRRLALAAALSDVDDAELAAVVEEMDRLSDRLALHQRTRIRRAGFTAPGEARAVGPEESFRLSTYNPAGIPLEVYFDGDSARATLVANALLEGPPDNVHGGVSSWLMDCMLGILVQAQGRPAVTASLDLRYLRRTPLDQPLALSARIVERSGRKLFLEGWIEHDGARTVEATGLFIEINAAVRG